MSVAALTIVLLVALGVLALVLNHVQARVAVVELSLNEGLPPGLSPTAGPTVGSADPPGADPGESARLLGEGLHVFLSRTCHACQRLIEELDATALDVSAPVHIRYIDRPRPIAASAAERSGATLHEHDADLARQVSADPLPFTVAVGVHGLVGRGASPTVQQMLATARDAGIRARSGAVAES